jgi:predicted DNA-binding protein (MmcQ/YjbR family)
VGVADDGAIERVRRRCLALPEAEERPFGGHTAPAFRVRDKLFVMTAEDGTAITLKAAPGLNRLLAADEPDRFFIPAYVGSKGWVGVRLGGGPDWDEIGELIDDSYRLIAPARLAAAVARTDDPAGRA